MPPVHNKRFLPILCLAVMCTLSCSETNENGEADSGSKYRISIITPDEWGGTTASGDHQNHTISKITLHHSGEEFKRDRDPEEYLRTLQEWSRTERGWVDIPYHYLIDLDGNIYAGRNPAYAGDTNTEYDPAGHLLTCVIGNYETAEPSEKQLEAIINLLAWQCTEFNIDPSTLKGHKDYANTACPGENLYPYVQNGYLIKEITGRIGLVELK